MKCSKAASVSILKNPPTLETFNHFRNIPQIAATLIAKQAMIKTGKSRSSNRKAAA